MVVTVTNGKRKHARIALRGVGSKPGRSVESETALTNQAPSEANFREAAEAVVQKPLGSTSLLQRRLKVGYGRAARIIDQLQEAGILGPADGSKARDVLVGLDDIDRICGPSS